MRQRGHVGAVAPQLLGHRTQLRIADARPELAHHHRGSHGVQVAEADPLHRRAHVGDRRAVAVEGGGIRQRDRARGQQGLSQHLADHVLGLAIGITQRQLQAQGGVDAGGEYQFAAGGLAYDQREISQLFHAPIIAR